MAVTEEQNRRAKRRAKIRLDERLLAMMLDLPENNRVVAVDSRNDPFGVEVIIEGPDLPEVPPEAEAPFAQVIGHYVPETGRLTVSLLWPDAEPMPNIGDTCCGKCQGGTCYVDQVTGA